VGRMTKSQAVAHFWEIYDRDSFVGIDGRIDDPMRREAWNNYTDQLCKDGQITDHQYSSWVHPF